MTEASKDTARTALFAAIGTIVTYFLNRFLNLPKEVDAAILTIVTFGLIYIDSRIHHSDSSKNGLVNF